MNKFEQKGGIIIIFLGLFMFSNYFNICFELNNQYFLFFDLQNELPTAATFSDISVFNCLR